MRNDKWELFTNEIWDTEKEATQYANRGNFKKKDKWKVVLYDKKYYKQLWHIKQQHGKEKQVKVLQVD